MAGGVGGPEGSGKAAYALLYLEPTPTELLDQPGLRFDLVVAQFRIVVDEGTHCEQVGRRTIDGLMDVLVVFHCWPPGPQTRKRPSSKMRRPSTSMVALSTLASTCHFALTCPPNEMLVPMPMWHEPEM